VSDEFLIVKAAVPSQTSNFVGSVTMLKSSYDNTRAPDDIDTNSSVGRLKMFVRISHRLVNDAVYVVAEVDREPLGLQSDKGMDLSGPEFGL
jgi:hypothetical protein